MFQEFPKIARLNRDCVISEKIDGTNAHVWIEDVTTGNVTVPPFLAVVKTAAGDFGIAAGSRTRFVTTTDDNHGFAKWVYVHAEELVTGLGAGRHYGEWWGQGIQRNYGLKEKRFSLFNSARWSDWHTVYYPENSRTVPAAPECCYVVPVLYRGPFNTVVINSCIDMLRSNGSVAAPGFMRAEGVVVFHTHANVMFKVTLEKDELPKSLANKS